MKHTTFVKKARNESNQKQKLKKNRSRGKTQKFAKDL